MVKKGSLAYHACNSENWNVTGPLERRPDPRWTCRTCGAMADVEGARRPKGPVAPGLTRSLAYWPAHPPGTARHILQRGGGEQWNPGETASRFLCLLVF